MGISRDSRHKRRSTGGRKANLKKKRQYESGRPPAMTKIGTERIHPVRVRGGSIKNRALRLETGNYSWGSEVITRKTKVDRQVRDDRGTRRVPARSLSHVQRAHQYKMY